MRDTMICFVAVLLVGCSSTSSEPNQTDSSLSDAARDSSIARDATCEPLYPGPVDERCGSCQTAVIGFQYDDVSKCIRGTREFLGCVDVMGSLPVGMGCVVKTDAGTIFETNGVGVPLSGDYRPCDTEERRKVNSVVSCPSTDATADG